MQGGEDESTGGDTKMVQEWMLPLLASDWSTAGSSDHSLGSPLGVRSGLPGISPPHIPSAPEIMWFSQVCGPLSEGRAFAFSEDRLTLVYTVGDSRDSERSRCLRGRH